MFYLHFGIKCAHYSVGLSIGDRVSVFADLEGKCKRGWSQEFCGSTAFVGNGILVKNRSDLFTVAVPRYYDFFVRFILIHL